VSNEPHLVIQGVDMVYQAGQRSLTALAGIDLVVRRGEFVSVIGPSGCGKSTLLRIVGGLQAPTRGRVEIDGGPSRAAQRRKQIGFVFQDASLLPWRSVIENVRLPLEVNRQPRPRSSFDPSAPLRAGSLRARPERSEGMSGTAAARGEPLEPRTASVSDPERLVDLVGLGAFTGYYPHQLSGGMQQRVAIARSLVTAPTLLLMDEPFGALDEITRSAMRFELLRVWRAQAAGACTVLFVTHSIAEAVLLADRVVVLSPQPGRVVADLSVDLPRPRPEGIEFSPAFLEYTRRLRDALREGVPPELAEGSLV